MKGTIAVRDHAGLKIHNYVSPDRTFFVTSQIVETPNALVIFDGQFGTSFGSEVADYAASLGKAVERIVLSHPHPDHWFGLSPLVERFPECRVHATEGVSEWVARNGPLIIDRYRETRPDDTPETVTIPQAVLPPGEVVIDGVTFEFRAFDEAEAAVQLVTRLPEHEVLFAVDLVWPRENHIIVGEANFAHWLQVLEALEDMPAAGVYVGHGDPQDRGAIDATVEYLRAAEEIYASASDSEEFTRRLTERFPARRYPEWVEFGADLLYQPFVS